MLERALQRVPTVTDTTIMDMELGSKKSRILAWTFKSRFPFSSLSIFSYCYDVNSNFLFYSVLAMS
jgi:hypothetical protein